MVLLMEMRHEVSHSYHGRNVIHRCSKAKVESIVMWYFAKFTDDCGPRATHPKALFTVIGVAWKRAQVGLFAGRKIENTVALLI